MAGKLKHAPVVTPETNGAESEVLDFASLASLAGPIKTTVQRAKRQRLQDFIGSRIFVLGLTASKRGTQLVRVSTNADYSDPSQITVPPAVLQGLTRAYAIKPTAVFAVNVVASGKGKRASATLA